MGVGIFSRRAYLFRHRGKRDSVFRNDWVWGFFLEELTCLDTGTGGALCFVMNECGDFFLKGLTCLSTGARVAPCFVMNGCGDFF